jgi:dCMP deaminase
MPHPDHNDWIEARADLMSPRVDWIEARADLMSPRVDLDAHMDCYQYGGGTKVEKFPVNYPLRQDDVAYFQKLRLSKWDKRFIKLAKEVSGWSKDDTKVGAVLTRPDHSLVSVGFNGFVPDMDDDLLADREFKNLCVRHAEENAIWFGRHEPSMVGYIMYIYGWPGPCGKCASAIAMAQLSRVVGIYETDAKTDWSRSIEASNVVLRSRNVKMEAYKWSTIKFTE